LEIKTIRGVHNIDFKQTIVTLVVGNETAPEQLTG